MPKLVNGKLKGELKFINGSLHTWKVTGKRAERGHWVKLRKDSKVQSP